MVKKKEKLNERFKQGQTLNKFYDFDFYPRDPFGTFSREEPAVLQSFTLINWFPPKFYEKTEYR
jgi:hypothetical protein